MLALIGQFEGLRDRLESLLEARERRKLDLGNELHDLRCDLSDEFSRVLGQRTNENLERLD